MAKTIWTEPALEDLRAIIDYISSDSPVYAERFGMRLVRAPRHLEDHPRIGRIVAEFDDHSIREIIYGSYRIIYQIRDENCFIVAVVHGNRELLRHLTSADFIIE